MYNIEDVLRNLEPLKSRVIFKRMENDNAIFPREYASLFTLMCEQLNFTIELPKGFPGGIPEDNEDEYWVGNLDNLFKYNLKGIQLDKEVQKRLHDYDPMLENAIRREAHDLLLRGFNQENENSIKTPYLDREDSLGTLTMASATEFIGLLLVIGLIKDSRELEKLMDNIDKSLGIRFDKLNGYIEEGVLRWVHLIPTNLKLVGNLDEISFSAIEDILSNYILNAIYHYNLR